MRRLRSSPLLAAAPSRLLGTPAWFAVVTSTVALLVASAVAPMLFASAAREAALQIGLEAVEENAFASSSAGVRAAWVGVLSPDQEDVVLGVLDDLPGFGPPRLTGAGIGARPGLTPLVEADGRSALSTLWFREGVVEGLGGSEDDRGVWLSADVADRLEVTPGDTVRMVLEYSAAPERSKRVPVRLDGVYERSPGSALPASVVEDASIARRDLPWDPDRPGTGSPLAIASRAAFGRLALKMGEKPLFTADLDLGKVDAESAAAAGSAVQRLGSEVYDGVSPVSQALMSAKPLPTTMDLASGLPDIVAQAESTSAEASDLAAPFAGAGIALAGALVLAAWVLLLGSRAREQVLMSGLGLRTREVAVVALTEAALPVTVGTLVGLGLGWSAVSLVGPPGKLAADVVLAAVPVGVLSGLAALVACALVSAVAAWREDRRAVTSVLGHRRVSVPWLLVLAVATVPVSVAVLSTAVSARARSPLVVVFPLLVAVTVSLLVLRGLDVTRPLGRIRGRSGTARWLAAMRSGGGIGREAVALTLCLAVGLAVLGYGLAVRRGSTEALADKVAAVSGAPTVVNLGEALAGRRKKEYRRPPVPGSTVVWRQSVGLPPEFGTQPMMVIDPATFADVADWGASGRLDEAREPLARLEEKGVLPAVLAGETDLEVGDQGLLNLYDEWVEPFVVVGVVDALPGSEAVSGEVTVVVGDRRLFKELPVTLDPRVDVLGSGAGRFTTWIWSQESSVSLRDDLAAAGVVPEPTPASLSASMGPLLAARWASSYVVALSACALLLAAAAALVLSTRIAERDAVADVMLRRMSWTDGDLGRARAWELAGRVGAALLAAGVALVVLVLAPTTIEAQAATLPPTVPRSGWTDVLALLGVGAALVAMGALVAAQRARRRVPGEVLRGNR